MADLAFFTSKGEVGGNQMLLSSNQQNLWLDFGLPFKKTQRYMNSLLEGRQLPKMKLSELSKERIIPPTENYEDGLRVLVTHAHYDHFGALFAPLEHDVKVEIFAPEDLLSLLRARMEVSARIGLFRKATLIPLGVDRKNKISDFEVIPISVDHSIDASYSYLITSPDGQDFFYTGDFRFDLISSKDLAERLATHTDKVDALLTELTGVHCRNLLKEQGVEREMKEVAKKFDGLTVLFATPSYTKRMESVKSAFQTKKLAVDSTYAYLLHVLGKDDLIDEVYITEKKRTYKPWEKELEKKFAVTGESQIEARQREVVVVLAPYHKLRLDFKFLPHSVAIVSLSEPFDEEGFWYQSKLENFLLRWKRVPVYYIHASGHAEAWEVSKFVEKMEPENIFVFHSQSPQVMACLLPHRKNISIPDYGEMFSL